MGTLRIISRSEERFSNRAEAGRLLARELQSMRGEGSVVLGIPRGGMVVAAAVAKDLDADLDVVLARKLGAPANPELAIGSVSEDGRLFLDKIVASYVSANDLYVESERRRQMDRIHELVKRYRAIRAKVPLEGRTAVITDDGVATGATMRAAAWAARHENPARIVIALPVGPEETVASLADDADEVVCLRTPPFFGAVGQFYDDFGQTEDAEVERILEEAAARQRA